MLPADTPTDQTPSSPTSEFPPSHSISVIVCLSLSLSLSVLLAELLALAFLAFSAMHNVDTGARCLFALLLNFCQLLHVPTPPAPPSLAHDRLHIRPQHCLHKPAPSPRPHLECVSVCKCEIFCISCHAQPTCQCNVYAICENYVYTVQENTFYPHTHTHRKKNQERLLKMHGRVQSREGSRVWQESGEKGERGASWLHLFACLTD